jgi:two-component system OmpR family sensor kinase
MTRQPAGRGETRPRRHRLALRNRLALLLAVVAAVVLALIALASYVGLRSDLLAQVDARLEHSAGSNAPPVGGRGSMGEGVTHGAPSGSEPTGETPTGEAPTVPPGEDLPLNPLDSPGQEIGTVLFRETDGATQSGIVLAEFSVGDLTGGQEDALSSVPADGAIRTVDLPELGPYRVLASAAPGGVEVTGLPLDSVRATLREAAVRHGVVGGAGLLMIALLSGLVIRRDLRTLDDVAALARSVTDLPLDRGDVTLAARTPHADPRTEVGQVGAALNELLAHVSAAMAARHASEQQVRRFVADASHELRTPLAAIAGYTELLRTRDLPPDDRAGALARIQSESDRMRALVEDLLLLARLDSGRALRSEPVDLGLLAADATMDAHAASPDHRWVLDLALGADEEAETVEVRGDEARLRQVLANLTANVAAHTPPATTATLTVATDGADAVLTVADDGPGLPPGFETTMFDRFARGEGSRDRAHGSTRLGLAISRAIVQAHGGTISASSTGGTVVTVRLPLDTGQATGASASVSSSEVVGSDVEPSVVSADDPSEDPSSDGAPPPGA